ncbi:hypothetical protein D8674_019564 [Pyrus ussuriensis x Pyrus communis]|uniref:Uncharacterized protein n=1 Tax=Pyrus ussuriensis x Pyrus communis TaxID=2448454 RepID=A0A5N5GDJ6_9ROSA|nr:hypothetical protein D8674_019564 [Pyrus ussuriensis x Pyrus communis]
MGWDMTGWKSGFMLCLVCVGQNMRVVQSCVWCGERKQINKGGSLVADAVLGRSKCSIGQIEALQNIKKERPRGYTITIISNLERKCRAEVHKEATRKRMRRKVAKGRRRAEEVHSGREENMIVRIYCMI